MVDNNKRRFRQFGAGRINGDNRAPFYNDDEFSAILFQRVLLGYLDNIVFVGAAGGRPDQV